MPENTPRTQKGARFQIFTGALRVETKTLPDGTTKKVLKSTASSTIKDRHGDEFTTPCIQKMAASAKESGMTIFLNHRYSVPEDVFGATTDATSVMRTEGMDTYTDMDLEMAVNETNPRAVATLAALEAGTKLGVSVGCLINEWHPRDPKDTWGWDGMIIDDVELLEASVVGIPANPRSWVKSAVKALKDLASGPTDDEDTNQTLGLLESVSVPQQPVQVIFNGFPPSALTAIQTASVKSADTTTPDSGDTTSVQPEATASAADQSTTGESTEQQPTDADATAGEAGAEDEATKGAATEQPVTTPSEGSVEDQTATTLEAAITQITAFKSARAEWETERIQLTKERDEAREGLRIASSIVEKIASLPLGRKTVFRQTTSEFRSKLAGVYDEDFLKFLERTPDE